MAARTYVALLRGINVGGRNPVPMAGLRAAFEAEGYGEVRTYIQSGNVVFETDRAAGGLESELEAMLARRLGLPVAVLARSQRQLRGIVDSAPGGFGQDPDRYHSDVVFLKAPLTSRAGLQAVELRDGVDEVWPGTGVLYFQRLSARRTQSRLSRLAGRPEYQRMTIRNWTTTVKLLHLCESGSATGSNQRL